MSESGDYDPGPWRGESFTRVREVHERHAKRSLTVAVTTGKKNKDLIEPKIITHASRPLAIVSDVTGSMGKDPTVLRSKLGYLDNEGPTYLGRDMEIIFGAVGDAYGDRYPVQIRKPAKGLGLKAPLQELVIEGGGGDGITESYELIALYFARLVETPKAIHKPILVLVADEKPYPYVNHQQAKDLFGLEITGRLTTKQIFEELKETWSVYLVRRYYGNSGGRNEMDPINTDIYNTWVDLVGADHIVTLPNADRVLDILFGILANETDQVNYFREEVTDRQMKDADGPAKLQTVFKALETIHFLPRAKSESEKSTPGVSVTRRSSGVKGKPTKRLI